jgi:AcrR family transcriptional regulator
LLNQSQETDIKQQEVSKRQERAHRILDAAATLILRWGYQKTTLDDISREAGVAKGTIYLHWKTREELFAALIKREKVETAVDLQQRISADPAGSTLRGTLKHSALALMKRPLLKAVLLNDMNILGKLAQHDHNSIAYKEKITGFTTYLEFLREHELIRTDLSLRAQAYIYSAIFMGFFLINPMMPDEFQLSDEEIADLMAETAHRTLEASRPVAAAELQTLSNTFGSYFDKMASNAHNQFQAELEE